ncbi:mechanosensitive ion channel family protein [Bhargavaea beijingensis]|uniref:Mechanosensitive ion channel family protein n=1 Tax=Bhargavaea beijingensis TaxID=426756 RepID=A0ABX9ZEQ1_9BACL|nr:mechanosensitive ion channel family protein [Bhargavaea beijingensis]MCW1929053.1 mechanosensitive ion channel family protein [Bhargavaea beijingensis]RSK34434.1 mechanosensitive ion channel family protein [Bhargavaea beijingensis]
MDKEPTVAETVTNEAKRTFDLIGKIKEALFSEELWLSVGLLALKILLIITIAGLVVRIGKAIIRRVFSVRLRRPLSERRERTLLKLLENVISYVVYFAAILAVLSAFHIDVAGMIAAAGVLGLAVGFGAQSLVKDVITGFFIIFEDQFSVGDYVRIGEAEGTVEEIGLRTTKIKVFTGELHIIPNGNIQEVINSSIYNSLAVIDVSVSYETNIPKAEALIREFLHSLIDDENYADLLAPPELLGVQSLGAHDVIMRITAETAPMMHFAVARKLRKDLKEFLERNEIEIPYPKMVMVDSKPSE